MAPFASPRCLLLLFFISILLLLLLLPTRAQLHDSPRSHRPTSHEMTQQQQQLALLANQKKSFGPSLSPSATSDAETDEVPEITQRSSRSHSPVASLDNEERREEGQEEELPASINAARGHRVGSTPLDHDAKPSSSLSPSTSLLSTPISSTSSSSTCLSDVQLKREVSSLKGKLISIMEHQLAIWALENRPDAQVEALHASKTLDLKKRLRAAKAELAQRRCPSESSVSTAADEQETPLIPKGRSLLQYDRDREEEDSRSSIESRDGIPAAKLVDAEPERQVPTTSRRKHSSSSTVASSNMEDDELMRLEQEANVLRYGAGIRPFRASSASNPSAFAELTIREIQSRHATEAELQRDLEEEKRLAEAEFVATITPVSPAPGSPQSSPSAVADLERRDASIESAAARRARLLRARIQEASAELNEEEQRMFSDEDDEALVGKFGIVASIRPMAAQLSEPLDEDADSERLTRGYGSLHASITTKKGKGDDDEVSWMTSEEIRPNEKEVRAKEETQDDDLAQQNRVGRASLKRFAHRLKTTTSSTSNTESL